MGKLYSVKKIFRTIQGEGLNAGSPALFVRLVGCNLWSGYEKDRQRDAERNRVHCPLWCDTDFTKERSERLSPEMLTDLLSREARPGDWIVVTGGEPFLQIDDDFVLAVKHSSTAYPPYKLAIETNGTVAARSNPRLSPERFAAIDHICVSPKTPPEQLKIEIADEIKVVVPYYDPAQYDSWASEHGVKHRYVQPCDEEGKEALHGRIAAALVLRNAGWRISVQQHKILGLE